MKLKLATIALLMSSSVFADIEMRSNVGYHVVAPKLGEIGVEVPNLDNAYVISTINTPESGITSTSNYFANSTYSKDHPAAAFDGRGSLYGQPISYVRRGYWIAQKLVRRNLYLGVMFNETKAVSGVSYNATTDTARSPKNLRIEYTTDNGASWQTEVRLTNLARHSRKKIKFDKTIGANGVRLYIENNHGSAYTQIGELEVLSVKP